MLACKPWLSLLCIYFASHWSDHSITTGVYGIQQSKQKWDFSRFVKTAAFYDALLPRLPFLSRLKLNDKLVLKPNEVIWSSKKSSEQGDKIKWGPLDDIVMGGVSKSEIEPGQQFTGEWKGYVSTANNGGFAGIRTKLFVNPLDASSCKGISIKVAGDGQRYKLIMRDDDDWNGTAWSYSIDTTNGKATQVKIPFSAFQPTKFAKVIKNYRPYDQSKITGIQISLSKFEYDGNLNPKFQEGFFRLDLESISTY